ncbi:MAG TPA: diguanylate cyclase [Roseiflexaceae bacterium]|nr:diguanylate cyclase [Roseiflexaceae bacterium]
MPPETDELTGLQGRGAFEGALKQALAASDGVALALIDVDNLKEINDEQGYAAGDEVLRALGPLLEQAAPGHAFRLGGDEFALILPDTTLEQAFLRLEGLRARAQAELRAPAASGERPVTIKAGVAQAPRDAKDQRGLVSAADAALQAAREVGRNTVCLPPNEEMVMKSAYYPATSLRRLKALAERLKRSESRLLREALEDLFRKYDTREGSRV